MRIHAQLGRPSAALSTQTVGATLPLCEIEKGSAELLAEAQAEEELALSAQRSAAAWQLVLLL